LVCWRWRCSVYHLPSLQRPQHRGAVSSAANSELRLRAINEEIVSLLPLGLLVHDQEANRTVISNPIADHLLPHLNLQNITNMADQHQGVIQATVNNELYEIRQYRSQVAPRTQILIIRDQDREVLVNKSSNRPSACMRKTSRAGGFMQHIGSALKQPAQTWRKKRRRSAWPKAAAGAACR
jgi:two-component system sensor histidine kinase RcsD